MIFNHRTITLTFGDRAENHVGMQIIGTLAENGFSIQNLESCAQRFEQVGCICEMIDLNIFLPPGAMAEEAKLLIIRNGVNALLSEHGANADQMFEELVGLKWDKKAKMYGRVVNKTARYNLCLDLAAQEPNYEEGRGRIVAYDSVPLTRHIRSVLPNFIEGGEDLAGELNYYYKKECGIGFHGDKERLKVLAIRLGESPPIHYQWFFKGNPVGTRAILPLNHGDMYVMSQKTTGNDWKKKNIYTLRHATGNNKFTAI